MCATVHTHEVYCWSTPHLPLRIPQLRLILPEGREETLAAKLGQTVQYTKAVLHERFDVPIDKQV